jgi:proteasome assembly chaperone (PAC2) family protein
MSARAIYTQGIPQLKKPIFIAGFGGWGNALNVSRGMTSYLVRRLNAKPFATLNPDYFYRFDETRPIVSIKEGALQSFSPTGGTFYAAHTGSDERDLVILIADEPNLRWFYFVEELFSLCKQLAVETVITLGSMYDSVLPSDKIISGIASDEALLTKLKDKNVNPIFYEGPSAIHSVVQSEGQKKGFQCISLWSHCPYYLQGATHYGLLSHLGALLAFLGEFQLDLEELDQDWKELHERIQDLIESKPELRDMIAKLRRAKVRGSWESMKASNDKDEKVIDIKDFLEPK